MATFSSSNGVSNTTAATFIPEIWSDEIIAAYKKNLVMANLVSKMSFKGKKGDTLNIPKPTRGAAHAKTSLAQVTLQAATESNVPVLINKHYEYSTMIEDITEAQALASLRQFYTSDAGYALATQVDTDILQLARFTEQAFTGDVGSSNTIRNGQIGDVYGVKVYVSSNCETATGAARIGLMFHKDAFVLVEQLGMRSQTQYKQEFLANLFTSDMLYGVKNLRAEAAVAIAMVA